LETAAAVDTAQRRAPVERRDGDSDCPGDELAFDHARRLEREC
jgi:hypothetical protein